MKKGFTLFELIIVVIIIGVLAGIGFSQYTKVVEKGITTEAFKILSQIRSAEAVYYVAKRTYLDVNDTNLGISGIPYGTDGDCASTNDYFYFQYNLWSTNYIAAHRCVDSGKDPQGSKDCMIALNIQSGVVESNTCK